MAKKPKAKTQDAPADAEAGGKRGSSKKMLLAAAMMCLLSLGGGFFLARMAYVEDAESYAPDYADGEKEAHGDDHAAAETDDHGGHGGEKEKTKLRTDIVDPLAKDGHDAEKALALQAKEDGKEKKDGEVADTGLLAFGDMTTNIKGFDAAGAEKTTFLKINLMVAYRPEEGSGKLMEDRQPFMRDLFNGYLRGLSETDVRGMSGILYVKAELLKRARAAVGSDLPQEVLINDLIVQ